MSEAETELETTVEEEIKIAFDDAAEAGLDPEDAKTAMIVAGAKHANVVKLYNKYAIESGLVLSKDAKSKIVEETYDAYDVTQESGFDAAVASMVAAGKTNISVRAASSLLRARAKEKGETCFIAPKKDVTPRGTFVKDLNEMLFANPRMTEKEVEDYVNANGNKTNVKDMKIHQETRALSTRLADFYEGEVVQEAA